MTRKYQNLIDQMTVYEKAAFLTGKGEWASTDIPRLQIPSVICSDGPHGLRRQAGAGDHLGINASLPATCFPPAATIANSWDVCLGQTIGEVLGDEANALGVNVLLGPGLNMKRSPLCGRNFEYFSEDPYLAGKMAASYVKGIQSQGIASCVKHFAVNSQEERRMAMNAQVDERTLREIYLTGFEIAVKEGGAKAVMSAYNEVNGTYANENKHLLTDILRKEWGFNGSVITDWGAANQFDDAIQAGSNLQMPNPGFDTCREVTDAIANGTLSMQDLDDRVDEQLAFVFALNQAAAKNKKDTFDVEAHHAVAHQAALRSAVLLKNENHILPLKENTKVVVIGDFAEKPRYQGAGSSLVNTTKLETVNTLIKQYPFTVLDTIQGYERVAQKDHLQLNDVQIEHIRQADVILYFFGLPEVSESEGLDRSHILLPQNQIDLLIQLAKLNAHVVGVLSGGSAIEMSWEKHCQAILHGYLNGQAGASAILDILSGKENPSGKLAETYPCAYTDTPAVNYYPAKGRTAKYKEGLYIGYRYYDTANVAVKYPFGFGLSYTSFAYSDLKVDEHGVTFRITNTGTCAGREISQMYVAYQDSAVYRPKKELKGFAVTELAVGEIKEVSISFDDKTFRYWDVESNAWQIQAGAVMIMIGQSVNDIVLTAAYSVKGTSPVVISHSKKLLPHYFLGNIQNVSDEEYNILLGYTPEDVPVRRKLTVNDAMCQLKHAYNPIGWLIFSFLDNAKRKSEERGVPDLNVMFQYNMPFRAIAKMTGGAIGMDTVRGLVRFMNGGIISGLVWMIYGFIKNAVLNAVYKSKLESGKE